MYVGEVVALRRRLNRCGVEDPESMMQIKNPEVDESEQGVSVI
jgi:hypothetical protein